MSRPPVSVRIYADHAATSAPKPPGVAEAVARFATGLGATPGRGFYAEAKAAGEMVQRCRRRVRDLLAAPGEPEQVIFTLNCSDALNLALKGVMHMRQARRHVVTTAMDHNSVLRPLHELREIGLAELTVVPCDPRDGRLDPADLEKALRPDTGLVAINHASNVTGVVQPAAEVGRICRARGIPFLLDAAQSFGHEAIAVDDVGCDFLAAPGHKGALGPQGTGFLWIRPGAEAAMRTLREGGTGTRSEAPVQPDFLPDRFEPGSVNALGLAGLEAALAWIEAEGLENLARRERALSARFLAGIAGIPGLRLVGAPSADGRVAVFSFRHDAFARPQALSDALEDRFGVLSRSGYLCAPLAHRTLGTHDEKPGHGGTTRLSFGVLSTEAEVDACAAALRSAAR